MGRIICKYKVSIVEGDSSGDHSFWMDVDKFREVVSNYSFSKSPYVDSGIADLNRVDLGNVVGGFERGDVRDCAYFSRKNWGSLVLKCKSKETANKCIEFLGLPGGFD